jgi:hypothetical protein
MSGEDVEADGGRFVGGVNEHYVADSALRDDAQDAVYQVTVWIKHGQTFTALDILADEIEKQCAFARAARPDQVQVPGALFRGQPNVTRDAGVRVLTQQESRGRTHRRLALSHDALELHRPNCRRRQMHETGEFTQGENHPAPVRLPATDILLVKPGLIAVIYERDQLVAAGTGKHAKRCCEVAGNGPSLVKLPGPGREADDGGK